VDGDGDDSSEVDMGAFEWQAYTLTINIVGSGEVGQAPDQPAYTFLDLVTLTATPAPGWAFTGWSMDITSEEAQITISLTGNMTLTATFNTQSIYLPMVIR
jgi:uncharacterized repeat protein (TIGR02543 family)